MTFTYDGDGKRVMSVIGTTTTYFVGNIYEKTGESETKYYHAGGSRIDPGTRVPGTCDGGLTPPRGATTVVTDASGNLISELRYSPWGETRYSSGVTATAYTFTGPLRLASQGLALAAGSGRAAQYSNVGDFGLLFYNARWYDPSLGRFASADSIVPPGIQGYDRYAYANNSPLMFTDPTGHFGKHNDDKSDYWNKQNQGRVKQLEKHWDDEKEAKEKLKQLVQASMKEVALAGGWGGPTSASSWYSLALTGRASADCDLPCWVVPDDWDLQPNHPDFEVYVVNISAVSIQYTRDRYGYGYLGPGLMLSFSRTFTLVGLSATPGWIGSMTDAEMPNWAETRAFLTGPALNGTAGAGTAGAGGTLSLGNWIQRGNNAGAELFSVETGGLDLPPSAGLTLSLGDSFG